MEGTCSRLRETRRHPQSHRHNRFVERNHNDRQCAKKLVAGRIFHRYLLVSATQLQQLPHQDWSPELRCPLQVFTPAILRVARHCVRDLAAKPCDLNKAKRRVHKHARYSCKTLFQTHVDYQTNACNCDQFRRWHRTPSVPAPLGTAKDKLTDCNFARFLRFTEGILAKVSRIAPACTVFTDIKQCSHCLRSFGRSPTASFKSNCHYLKKTFRLTQKKPAATDHRRACPIETSGVSDDRRSHLGRT
jgi:hypothetical protein